MKKEIFEDSSEDCAKNYEIFVINGNSKFFIFFPAALNLTITGHALDFAQLVKFIFRNQSLYFISSPEVQSFLIQAFSTFSRVLLTCCLFSSWEYFTDVISVYKELVVLFQPLQFKLQILRTISFSYSEQ